MNQLNLYFGLLALAMISATLARAGSTVPYGITVVIRDQPFGTEAYVATSDTSFAVSGSTQLSKILDHLDLLSVNDESIFGVKLDGKTFTANYKFIESGRQDAIREIKSQFNQNLIGLVFATSKSHKHDNYKADPYPSSNSHYTSNSNNNYNNKTYNYQPRCTSPYSYSRQKPAPTVKKIKVKLGTDSGKSFGFGVGFEENLNTDETLQNLLHLKHGGNETDTGVFQFDTKGCPLNVYCETYSVQSRGDLTVLFNPDASIYMYSKPHLAYDIIWFLVIDDRVFFVYSDGTVLAKLVSQLDQTELNLLISSRDDIKNINTLLSGGESLFE